MSQTTNEAYLESRYGTTRLAKNRTRLVATVGAVGVGGVLVAWLWWAGLAQPTAQFQARDLGYTMVDDRNITVSFEITVDPGTAMACAIQALNAQYGIVGWTTVSIPPSDQRTRVFEQPLRTSETAVTGLLYRCWVA